MFSLEEELKDIQKSINSSDFTKASSLFEQLISRMSEENDPDLAMIYYEYGMFLFDLGDYQSAVSLLIAAYELNYERQTILTFLYDCFVLPNQSEFEKAYELQCKEATGRILYDTICSYEELPLDFIPVNEQCFYIFDKTESKFCGCVDYSEQTLSQEPTLKLEDEFSDLTISGEWNLSVIATYIKASDGRLLYLLSNAPAKTLSFYKLPDFYTRYVKHLLIFDSFAQYEEYFHSEPSIYLPRLLFGKHDELSKQITNFLQQEHEYRLTPEGRRADRLLLSLCIPTWNRGHRALENVKSLLNISFDAEIEIVISNNGSEFYQKEYEEIQNMKDARIRYSSFETNQGFALNIAQVIHLSSAPYALIISDEDSLIAANLGHYLTLLRKNPTAAIIRSYIATQYPHLPNACYPAGMSAFRESFLKGNYISGCIYNTRIFKKLPINDLNQRFNENVSYNALGSYPHMWWNSILVFLGDYCSDGLQLIEEGKSDLENQIKLQGNYDTFFDQSLNGLPEYAQIEYRMKQHLGFISLINMLPFETIMDRMEGYSLLCAKTLTLFTMVLKIYLNAGHSRDYICDQFQSCILNGIDYLDPPLLGSTRIAIENLCMKLLTRLRES